MLRCPLYKKGCDNFKQPVSKINPQIKVRVFAEIRVLNWGAGSLKMWGVRNCYGYRGFTVLTLKAPTSMVCMGLKLSHRSRQDRASENTLAFIISITLYRRSISVALGWKSTEKK